MLFSPKRRAIWWALLVLLLLIELSDALTADPYKVLGVPRTASKKEIRHKYKKLAIKYHPDRNPNAREKFKEINVAYDILSDDDKRAAYDRGESDDRFGNGPHAFHGGNPFDGNNMHFTFNGGGAGGFEQMFGNMFGNGGNPFGAGGFPGGMPFPGGQHRGAGNRGAPQQETPPQAKHVSTRGKVVLFSSDRFNLDCIKKRRVCMILLESQVSASTDGALSSAKAQFAKAARTNPDIEFLSLKDTKLERKLADALLGHHTQQQKQPSTLCADRGTAVCVVAVRCSQLGGCKYTTAGVGGSGKGAISLSDTIQRMQSGDAKWKVTDMKSLEE